MNEGSQDLCAYLLMDAGHTRNCKNPVKRVVGGKYYCKKHTPETNARVWEGPQYRRVVKQGGSRMLSVSNALGENWNTVAMEWSWEGTDIVVLKLQRVN